MDETQAKNYTKSICVYIATPEWRIMFVLCPLVKEKKRRFASKVCFLISLWMNHYHKKVLNYCKFDILPTIVWYNISGGKWKSAQDMSVLHWTHCHNMHGCYDIHVTCPMHVTWMSHCRSIKSRQKNASTNNHIYLKLLWVCTARGCCVVAQCEVFCEVWFFFLRVWSKHPWGCHCVYLGYQTQF